MNPGAILTPHETVPDRLPHVSRSTSDGKVLATSQTEAAAPGSARPSRRRNARATKATLLDAARRCFVEKGFDATRVDEIAQTAGVNKRMLYVYFGNKEQLYAEVLRASFRSAAALAQVQDDPNVDPVKHIRSIITEFFHFVAENPGFVRLVGWENLRYRSSNVLADILGVGLHGLYATVERGKRLGVIRPDLDAQKTVLSVTTLCIGYFSRRAVLKELWGHDLGESQMQQELLDHVVSICLFGICSAKKTAKKTDNCS